MIALETALNGYLRLDSEQSEPRLVGLTGKSIAIRLSGIDLTLYFCPTHGGVRIRDHIEHEADVWIEGSPFALVRLMRGERATGEVIMRGNIETATKFQALLQHVDIDWEEHLSHVLGDIGARQIGNQVRNSISWGRQTFDTLLQNTSEYLRFEHGDLPARHNVERFLDGVDELCADTDRLAARIERLRRTLNSS